MCKARYCLVCEVPFHEEQTCDQYQVDAKRRNKDEKKSLEAVKKLSRPCPGPGCGVNIDKYSGCDHVTCKDMYTVLFGMSPATDYDDRPQVQARVLLAVLCSLCWSQRYPRSRKSCTPEHLHLLLLEMAQGHA